MPDPKTGTAGSFGNDPASQAFIAECGPTVAPTIGALEGYERDMPEPRTVTLHYSFTVTTAGDPRAVVESGFRFRPGGKVQIRFEGSDE